MKQHIHNIPLDVPGIPAGIQPYLPHPQIDQSRKCWQDNGEIPIENGSFSCEGVHRDHQKHLQKCQNKIPGASSSKAVSLESGFTFFLMSFQLKNSFNRITFAGSWRTTKMRSSGAIFFAPLMRDISAALVSYND